MQSLGHACILLYFMPIEQRIFLASQFRVGRVFPSGSISFKSTSNFVKILSVQPLVTFKFISLKTADNRVNLVEPIYNGVSASADIVSYTCACAKASTPTSVSCLPYCLLLLLLVFKLLFSSLFPSLFHVGIGKIFSPRNSWNVY